jgi:hypothetical protein
VVGGPTGAGKSTLLNSLVRAPVSAAGVLRPTTRRPVLVCNPRDWAAVRRHGLRPICAPLMPEGIAVIDAPDIDSIEPSNRALADELFAEADLWLFVTTASRYADAANWRHLRAARDRRVALAVVLDRVAAGTAPDIIDHMRDLLGPPEPPLFVIPETPLDRQGMLPDSIAAPLRGWLADVVEAARMGPPQPAIGVATVPAEYVIAADTGLTLEFELTPAAGAGETAAAADGDADGVPDAELSVAAPLRPGDLAAEDLADQAASEAGADSAASGEAAPEVAVPEEAVPDEAAAGEAVLDEAIPGEAATGEAATADRAVAEPADPADDAADSDAPEPAPGSDAGAADVSSHVAEATAATDGEAAAEGADGVSGVVESSAESADPSQERQDQAPADLPKAADVGETVKL